ncbi:MAG: type II toxin-antitoxin system PemK/MazF family toxin [Bacilli bacterium]|nr:type II toxin-antitoxin system PemK/MazF family toxin [Bacilli bacterium]
MDNTLEQNRKHTKLIKAHQNNLIISDMNLKDKYTNFEDSKLSESKTLLYEINKKPTNFKRYSRGRIVKVRFGVNIGSEFSGDHFAIIVSKGDTMKSSTLHIIPITSKKHTKNIKIGTILYSKKEITKLKNILKQTEEPKEIKKINSIIKYYENRKDKTSYACVDHLKTISKLSISNNINEYDYLPNLKCSTELMKIIDEAIIKEYTI